MMLFWGLLFISFQYYAQVNNRIVLGYFPSWSESWTSSNQNSKLREIPNFVNYIFLGFAKPNLEYTSGSFDISKTGIEVPYDGCTLEESVAALKNKGIKVILSIGGETYWGNPNAYNINYNQIKSLVDDIGFAGIDWDYEPDGSFANIGDENNINHFIDFFNKSRAIMPKSEGYILACAPAGAGALGGIKNNDTDSPFSYNNRNLLTGESDANLYNSMAQTNGINLFGYSSTGHMIPVIKSVGDKIDLIAFQGYNIGGSRNRSIMYDSYAYYAEKYGFSIAAGVHYPNEPWGPYFEYTHENVASLASHIVQNPSRTDNKDGIMIWQILSKGNNSSALSYLNVASKVLNGNNEANAIQNANNFSTQPYNGGAKGCTGNSNGNNDKLFCGIPEYNPSNSYPNPNTKVYFDSKIWSNKWYANPNEAPNSNSVWELVSICNEANLSIENNTTNKKIKIHPNPTSDFVIVSGINKSTNFVIFDLSGKIMNKGKISNGEKILFKELTPGSYLLKLENFNTVKIIKN